MANNVYVAFVDSRKAFDTVWRRGLMYILKKLGVKSKLLRIIDDCHIDTKSTIVVKQTQSCFFHVHEGGVLFGILYLVFINDIFYDLEMSNPNTGILNIASCAISIADDISCIGNNPATVQCMLDVCYTFSRKWHLKFSASKSSVVRFLMNTRNPVDFVWKIGDGVVPVVHN